MDAQALNNELQGIDISLLDQILKGRFTPGSKVLDAGFGLGRNSIWFINNGFDVFGVDKSERALDSLKASLSDDSQILDQFSIGSLEELKFEDSSFDLVICNAVLHFATDFTHFNTMLSELVRVLSPGGILFIRMTSDIGIKDKINELSPGVFRLPDGSKRFLLNQDLLQQIMNEHRLTFIEPLKTVNVNDQRAMSTLVLSKSNE